VKALLEGQGYAVKGEVCGCDLVAVRGTEPPVIVELKRSFGIGLVLQGIDRLTVTDAVYLAVGAWPKRLRDVKKLCRRLGLGLIVVHRQRADLLLDPAPYRPRKNPSRVRLLLREHAARAGDPNRGGSSGQPILTAYRQEALRCAAMLAAHGPMSLTVLRAAADVPRAGRILQRNVYGWFERVGHATYALSAEGRRGLARFTGRDGASPADTAADVTVR
jgi:hypothetical protein